MLHEKSHLKCPIGQTLAKSNEKWTSNLRTYRVLNEGNPDLYPVVVGFSRPVNEYERLALKDFGVIRGSA